MEPPIPSDDPAQPAPPAQPDAETSVETFGAYSFDARRGEVAFDGRRIRLTAKEFALALALFRGLGQPLARADLLMSLWGRAPNSPTRTLDAHIGRVRAKLDLGPDRPYSLTTLYAVGYRLDHVEP